MGARDSHPAASQLDIHHRVGNLQTWCGDGPPGGRHQPVARYLFGAAWNTPAGRTAITAIRSRQLLGGSRGIGLRPVRDTENRTLETAELAGGLWRWIHSLRDRAQPLQTLDQTVLDLLAPPPQPAVAAGQPKPIADFGPMYEPAPGNPSWHSCTKRSLNPRPGRSAIVTNSTPLIGRESLPGSPAPTRPPTRRASKVM